MMEMGDRIREWMGVSLAIIFVLFAFSCMRPYTIPLRNVQLDKELGKLRYTGTQEKDDGGIVVWNFSTQETVLYPVLDPGERAYAKITSFFFVRKVELYVPREMFSVLREEGINGKEDGIY